MAHRTSQSPRSRANTTRAPSALLLSILLVQAAHAPAARAEDTRCPLEPKREIEFLSKEWRMAKFADLNKYISEKSSNAALAGAGSLLKTAITGGTFEEFGKAVVTAVVDSYVPGLSKMMFQQQDPLAAQTQLLLDAIANLENTMTQIAGEGWAEFRTAERNDIKTKLEAARDGIRNWNLTYGPNGGWATSATLSLYDQTDRLTYVLNQIEIAVKTPGSATGIAPYPYLSLIEVYTEVMQLLLLNNPNYLARAQANDNGIFSQQAWQSSSAQLRQLIDNRTREATLAVMDATIDDALVFAQQISNLDPYKARAAWSVAQQPTLSSHYGAQCDEDTTRVRADATRYLGPLILTHPWPPLPDVVYTYTAKSMDIDYTTIDEHHCIVRNGPGGWLSTHDSFATVYETVNDAFVAHQKGSYNQLLRVGWGPFAIVLDKWWQALRAAGLRSGLRPALALDTRLGDYLLQAEGTGATTKTAMYGIGVYSNRQPSAQERALLVDYALEYGPEKLLSLAATGDEIFFPTLRTYPLEDRLRFVTEIRNPDKMVKYFNSVQTARMLPLL